MKTLIDHTFDSPTLPTFWQEDVPDRCEPTTQGLVVPINSACHVQLPEARWQSLEVVLELDQTPNLTYVQCGDGATDVKIDFATGRHAIVGPHATPIRLMPRRKIPAPNATRLTFHLDPTYLGGRVGEQLLCDAAMSRDDAAIGSLRLIIAGPCRVRSLRITGEGPQPRRQPQRPSDFHLQVAVDFLDDLVRAPFTPAMFDAMFEEFARWGVCRCQWIYLGGSQRGLWRRAPYGVARHAAQTFDNCGEILPQAVRAAHDHGIALDAVIKPFETALAVTCPDNSPLAKAPDVLPRIGGPVLNIMDFVRQRRDLCMQRKPTDANPNHGLPITTIELVKEDDDQAAFSVDDVQLLVSDDNATYRPYAGQCLREEYLEQRASNQCRVMRLTGLTLSQPYFALLVKGRQSSFSNVLADLIHVYTNAGEDKRLTLGLAPRREGIMDALPQRDGKTDDFRQHGVMFDYAMPPTASKPGLDVIEQVFTLDAGRGFLAIARGKDATPIGCLSPAFAESRQWWLQWANDALEAGVDGIEWRMVSHHHATLAWREFGFEKPVIDAFRKRYDVDLEQTDAFNLADWRRLRGEAMTQSVEQVSELTRRHGKRFGLHITEAMAPEPQIAAAMQIHWHWQHWLEHSLADAITLKNCPPQSAFGERILALADQQHIPAIYCPYSNRLWQRDDALTIMQQRIEYAAAYGCAGFCLYEAAPILHAATDKSITMTQPALRELLAQWFKR